MGGGGGSSSTYPQIPDWLDDFLMHTAVGVSKGQSDMPISDFYEMDPRQIAGPNPLQEAAASNVGQFFSGPSPALSGAMDAANQLANPTQWQGTDLSGIGSVGGISVAGPGGGGQPPVQAPPPPTAQPNMRPGTPGGANGTANQGTQRQQQPGGQAQPGGPGGAGAAK